MTSIARRILAAMGLAGALALGGCAYDDGYGYGGVSVGAGSYGGGYYDPYYSPGYYQPGLYTGWYDGFYYPGSGYYVYDRGGRRHRWNDGQRRYWEGRRHAQRDEWRGRNRGPDRNGDGRPDQWRGRDRNGDGRPDRNWTNRPRVPQDADGNRGRGAWRERQNERQNAQRNDGERNNAVRRSPRVGAQMGERLRTRQARPSRPQMTQPRQQARPQASQPRPQRSFSRSAPPVQRSERPARSSGREPGMRVRPD